MANTEHAQIAPQGAKVLDAWRKTHANQRLDLGETDLGRANWPRPNRKGVSYVLSATSVTTTFVAFFMLHSALPTLAVGNLVLGCREPGGIAPRLCLRVGRDSDG